MKKTNFFIALTLIIINCQLSIDNCFAQNVGINASSATPNASAGLDVDFADKGLLIPRIALTSTTIATPITTPATSLLVYNTATVSDVFPGYYYWDSTKWVRMINAGNSNGTDWSLTGNAGTTSGTNFLGTTDAQDLAFKTNGTEKIRILNANGNVGIGTSAPNQKLDVRGTIKSEGAQPALELYRSTAPLNNKWWNIWIPANDTFRIQALTDAGSGGGQVFDLARSGNNLTSLRFGDSFSNKPTLFAQGQLGGFVGIGTNAPGEMLTIGTNNFVFHNGGDKAIGFNTDWTSANQWTKIAGSNYQGRIHFNPTTGDLGFISSSVATGLNNLIDNKIFIKGGTGTVGIGTVAPDTSSILDVSSSNKGVLMPQIALTSWNDAITILQPATSLMVYNTGTGGLIPSGYYYNAGTAVSPHWVSTTGDCVIWSTNTTGNYNIKTIVDAARTSGQMAPGIYDECILKTDNPAHWNGRSFKLNANFYISPSWPHQIYDVVDITAWPSGCFASGLTSFNASTGAFSFNSGSCSQTITLTCPCQPK